METQNQFQISDPRISQKRYSPEFLNSFDFPEKKNIK